jgi:hypothetical protein
MPGKFFLRDSDSFLVGLGMEAFIFLIRHIEPRCLPSVALTPGGLLVYQWQIDRSTRYCQKLCIGDRRILVEVID